MKYVISWFERPQGSPIEYENAQKRILEVFGLWKAPANFKVEFFVVRVVFDSYHPRSRPSGVFVPALLDGPF
jgi:hypothetical protein